MINIQIKKKKLKKYIKKVTKINKRFIYRTYKLKRSVDISCYYCLIASDGVWYTFNPDKLTKISLLIKVILKIFLKP